jgi:hypothetical protein
MKRNQASPTHLRLPWVIAVAAVLFALPFCSAGAQTTTGTVTGTVNDSTRAVIVGAEVRLTNTGTGVMRKATTDQAGNFRFLLLPSGVYSLEAEIKGFKKFRRDGIIVEVDRSMAVPVTLEVGQVTETVEVRGGTPLLEPNTATLGTVMDRRKVEDLPLSGRNTFGLANLIPTVRGIGYFGGALLSTWRMGQVTVGGGGPMANGFQIDGIANEKMTDFSAMAFLTVDATQEFKVETNAMSAEFGRTGGGIITVISKSGTNEFHGVAFDFLRNNVMNSQEYFANAAGRPLGPVRVNQFGGTLGGRIIKDKLFFFGNYEGYRERRSTTQTITSPTAQERGGDFSNLRAANGSLITVYDPSTTRPNPASPGTYIRDPFAGNVIPGARISPVAANALKYYPMPNLPGLPYTHAQNLFQQASIPIDKDAWGVRIDYNLAASRRLSGRYTRDALDWGFANYFNNIADVDGRHIFIPRQSAFLQFTDTLTPTLLIDAKIGVNRENEHSVSPAAGFDVASLGFPASYAKAIQKKGPGPGFPIFGIADATTFGRSDSNGNPSSTGSFSVGITKIRGKHSLKSGWEQRLYRRCDWGTNFNSGSFSFSRGFTQGPNPLVASTTAGYGVASFLLGTPSSGQVGMSGDTAVSMNFTALYFQDDWKVTPKLTLNLGLRWEYEGPARDRFNTYPNFDPSITSPLQAPGMSLKGGNVWPESGGLPKGLTERSMKNLGPRLGFAYHAKPKTVVRGGYGIMYIPTFGPSGLTATGAGFLLSTPMVTTLDGGLTPQNTLNNPFPDGLLQLTGSSLGAMTSVGASAAGQLRNVHRGYTQQWNLTIQHEPWPNWLFEAAWVGNHGSRLITNGLNLNALPDQYLSLGSQLLTTVSNPFYGIIKTGTLSAATVTRRQLLLPFPQFTAVSGGSGYLGNSIYHAFALKVEKRFSQGFSLLAAYTASKLIEDLQGTGRPGAVGGTGIQNWNNLRGERARSYQDIPQRLVLTALWEVPYKPANPILKQVLGGWQVNGITTIESGRPIGLVASISNGGNRPNSTGNSAKLDNPTLAKWFDTSAFTQPAPFTYGNVSRTLPDVNSDGMFNMDFSVFKTFPLTERFKLQFRAEAFNLTNTPTFEVPGQTLGSATFGVVTATAFTPKPREVQLALKLIF